MKKTSKKPTYESPALIPLGELARGAGRACTPVGSAPSGRCGGGNAPPPVSCNPVGQKASSSCSQGRGIGTPSQ